MGEHENKLVRVYELYPVSELIRLSDEIEKVITGPYGINNSKGIFTVSNTTGFISFTDHSKIWSSKNSNFLPPTKFDAIKIVENFLDNINSKIQSFNDVNKSSLPSFFPTRNQRKVKNCDLVIHRDSSWYDHWLCTYELQLSAITSESDSSFIYGMGMEVRIGKNNNIVSIASNWRPFANIKIADLFLPNEYSFVRELFHSATDENHLNESQQNSEESSGEKSQIVYVFDGDAGNQYQLSPYYFATNEDHIIFYPACKYSLTIIITQEIKPEETILTAYIYGGSGHYRFNWAYWNKNSIWDVENQIVIIGEGNINSIKTEKGVSMLSSISLPLNFYNILLNVADIKTGAYKQAQQIIF